MKTRFVASVLLFAGRAGAAPQHATVPCEVLTPVLDAQHTVATAPAPDGKSYPVFRAAPASQLLEGVRHELDGSFAQQALRLDRYARNLITTRREKARASVEEWLTAPMYLLMSTEEGGFARFGFWLEDAAGKRTLVKAGYVDLVISQRSIDSGDFEEIFPHELGHLVLKALTGGFASGQSRKMHQSMAVTDYATAFDEGHAEHFQALARDATANPYLRKVASGTGPTDLELLWLSAADAQLRTDGVKRNLFIHSKPLPAIALDPNPDLYRVFVEAETSTAFVPTELKTGQGMMASEGVIATLFYRIVNDAQLRGHYREASFYQSFLRQDSSAPENAITPYENANLKLFAAMAELGGADRPPMIALVERYAKLFPDEAKQIYGLFVETTWGATVSQQLALELERAASDGGRGDMAAFRQDRPFPLLDATIAQVVDGKRALDANLGPELWIVNTDFRIAGAMWSTDRNLPLTMNLNTATEAELMTIRGMELRTARGIVNARRVRGFFQSIDELSTVLPSELVGRFRSMAEQMKQIGPYPRD
jgi:hypothetical protein